MCCACVLVPVFNYHEGSLFRVAALEKLSGVSVVSAMGLGFLLALLIFIDQNIVVSLTNAPENRYTAPKKNKKTLLNQFGHSNKKHIWTL